MYDLEIVVREGDELKLCEAKFLANVYLQSYELQYYDCDKQNFEERDDMPMEDVEDDDSDSPDCANRQVWGQDIFVSERKPARVGWGRKHIIRAVARAAD